MSAKKTYFRINEHGKVIARRYRSKTAAKFGYHNTLERAMAAAMSDGYAGFIPDGINLDEVRRILNYNGKG